MKLIKRAHKYSSNKYEYEVLDREKIEDVIDNLDEAEVAKEILKRVVEYAGLSASVYAEISIEDGEVYYSVDEQNTITLVPDFYVRIMSFGDISEVAEVDYDYLLHEDEIDQVYKLKEKEELNTFEAFREYIAKNEIDMEERTKEYIMEAYSNLSFCEEEEIKLDLDRVYMED